MINIKSKTNNAGKLDLSPVVSSIESLRTTNTHILKEVLRVHKLQEEEISVIKKLSADLEGSIKELKTSVTTGNVNITKELSSANSKYDKLVELLTSIKNKPDADPVDFSKIEKYLKVFETQLKSVDTGIKEVIGKLTVTEIKGCYEKQSESYSNGSEEAKGNLAIGFAISTEGEDLNFKSTGKVFIKKGEVLNKPTLIRRFEDWLQYEGFIGNVNLDIRKDKRAGNDQAEVVSIFVEGFTYNYNNILTFSSEDRMTGIYGDFIYIHNKVPATLNKYFDKDGNEVVSARKVFIEGKEESTDYANFSTNCKDSTETLLESINNNLSDSKDINITRTVFHTKEEKVEYPKNKDGEELDTITAHFIETKEEDIASIRESDTISLVSSTDIVKVHPKAFRAVDKDMVVCPKNYNEITKLLFDQLLRMGKLVYGVRRATDSMMTDIRDVDGFENAEGFYEIIGEQTKYSTWVITMYEPHDISSNGTDPKIGLFTLPIQSSSLEERRHINRTNFKVEADNKTTTIEYTKYILETHKDAEGNLIKDVWLTNVGGEVAETTKPEGFIVGEPSPSNQTSGKVIVDNSSERVVNSNIAHTIIDSGSINSLPKDENGTTLDTLRYYVIPNTPDIGVGEFTTLHLSLDKDDPDSLEKVTVFNMNKSYWKNAGMSVDFYNWLLPNVGADTFDVFSTADEVTIRRIQAISGFEHVRALYGFGGREGKPDFYIFSRAEGLNHHPKSSIIGISLLSIDDSTIVTGDIINIEYTGYEESLKPDNVAPTYKKYVVETHKDLKGTFIETKWFTNVNDKLTEVAVPEGFILGEPSISDIKITGDSGSKTDTTNLNLEKVIAKLEEIKLADTKNTEVIEGAIKDLKDASSASNTDTSNKLTAVIAALKVLETDNDDIIDVLLEQVSELMKVNKNILDLIEVGKPNTLAISIPEAATYEYNGGDISDEFVVRDRDGDVDGSYELDPTTNKLLFTGPLGIEIGKYLTVNSTIKYNLKARVTQITRDERTSGPNGQWTGPRYYYGMNSYDGDKVKLSTDNRTSYNYGIADRAKIPEGDTVDFSGIFGGYNPLKTAANSNESIRTKFDPFASYAKPIMLFNWYGGKNSKTLLESFKIEPVEGTYKVFSGSVSFFFDKNGKEVQGKRLFMKEGKEVEEPQFWDYNISKINSKLGDKWGVKSIKAGQEVSYSNFKSLTFDFEGKGVVTIDGEDIEFPIGKRKGLTVSSENVLSEVKIKCTEGNCLINILK